MKIDLDNGPDEAQIQIVPLIDVIFCILTFFILAVLQLRSPQGMNVDIPNAATGTVQPPERMIVTLSPSGQTYVGQEEVDRTSLADRARKYLESRPDGVVVLNASQNAFYSDVIGILDLMRKVGGSRVALATNPATSPSPSPSPGFGIPGLNNPGLNNPGLNNPGLNNPSLNNPGLNNPGLNNPGNSGLFPSGIPGSTPSPTPLVPGSSQPALGTDPTNPIGQPNSTSQPNSTTTQPIDPQDQVIPVEPLNP
jgi:biopolymer transport protein ExbD